MNRFYKVTCLVVSTIISLGFSPVSSAWMLEEDFNNGTPGSTVDSQSNIFSDSFETDFSKSVVFEGAGSAVLSITEGKSGFGEFGGLARFPQYLHEGDEVYVRIRTFYPTDFSFKTSFNLKFLRFRVEGPDGKPIGHTDIYITNSGSYYYQNELYTTKDSTKYFGDAYPIKKGEWETVIYNVKYSANNARVRFWKHVGGTVTNGKRQGGHMELLFDETKDHTLRSSTDNKVGSMYLFSYWNGLAPKTQKMYIDDFMISTIPPPELDGTIQGGTQPPNPPGSIN